MNSERIILSNAEFQLRIRQAILVAQNIGRQFALLLVSDAVSANHCNPDSHREEHSSWLATWIRNTVRDSDTVMHLRNEEIAVLLPAIRSADDVDLVIRRILKQIEQHRRELDHDASVPGPKIGAAIFPDHGNSVDAIVTHANQALAEAQRMDSDYFVFHASNRAPKVSRHWMAELRHAIVEDQLFLAYQPKIDLTDGHITGVEALTRWRHPELGLIAPDEFIPIAERTGLIIPLTLWVLQRALQQCRIWHDMGFDINVAVNLTMWNLEAQELPHQIGALLQDTGVPPEALELEITESTLMGDPQRVINTLRLIRNMGPRFAIDDFGTGYSSFAYLTKFPVSCIKIDKGFVLNIDDDRENAVIVKSIIDLGHNLGLKVVAEGIETASSRQLLRRFHCDEGQGYYFSRPISADEMSKFFLNPPRSIKIPRFFNGPKGRASALPKLAYEELGALKGEL